MCWELTNVTLFYFPLLPPRMRLWLYLGWSYFKFPDIFPRVAQLQCRNDVGQVIETNCFLSTSCYVPYIGHFQNSISIFLVLSTRVRQRLCLMTLRPTRAMGLVESCVTYSGWPRQDLVCSWNASVHRTQENTRAWQIPLRNALSPPPQSK